MHVRHVVRQFHPAVGGLEHAVGSLAATLSTMPGIETSVVTLDRLFQDRSRVLPHHDRVGGVPVTRIPFAGSTRYPLAPAVLRALDGADIVHVHGIDFFFDFLAATRPIHRRLLVASTHGGFFHTRFASRLKTVYFNSVTRASALAYARIFGSSVQDSARFRRIAPRRTVTIENGVDVAKWRGRAAAAPRSTLPFIGRFSVNKEIPRLFDLLAMLPPEWRLIVAGQPSDLSVVDLRETAAAAAVAARVVIVAGADDTAMTALIERSSYIVSASRYEGFGLTMVEGLAAGLTPLMSDIPPFRRLQEVTGRGLLLDFRHPRAAAEHLAAAHETMASAYAAERAQNIAAADPYGWDGAARRFADEYRRVLERW